MYAEIGLCVSFVFCFIIQILVKVTIKNKKFCQLFKKIKNGIEKYNYHENCQYYYLRLNVKKYKY
jgi:hypothetical protein